MVDEAMRTYLWESAPVVALFLDSRHCLADANVQARRLLGDQALGRPLTEQLVDFSQNLDLASLFQQGDALHRLTLSTLSGLPETLIFQFFPVTNGTLALGSLDFEEQQTLREQVLGLNQELNNMTRQLHQANAELRELNELKNRFVGMAAHDLRRPLSVIMAYSEFVLDEAGDRLDDEQRGFLRTSLAAACGMKRLIENFLEASVIESGHLALDRSTTHVTEIVAGVLPLVSLLAAKKKIELVMDLGEEQLTLSVDVARLQQVLVNLLSNALEYSKAGQRVWLVARRQDQEMVFAVRDEGVGISPEDQKLLFAPFAHAGTRKTAGERSVGLGLAIARLVVQTHGGRIWVDSEPGRGSTFFVALPIEGP